ncbi:SWI/SNF-related matrix-associated actin-dependent regulator of chromatin subfamily E member 1-like isoform X1 [Lates japonicus]|uniref:SWI/SNF-related matrix-associated actin-dependent regulator of chromatin subfamily E member 1-like isoform X1 n=1 Tax=Lates japonicus TaxID=270547 RepID=A0AAD3MVC6_LATJO|nr:SWI/SNF-related matrix-associated actin-dependent regulator of chromatin subfamily E member 1-like isoform X1 [Lates japonicus]
MSQPLFCPWASTIPQLCRGGPVWLAFPVKATTYTLWWGVNVLGANDWNRLIPTPFFKDVKEAILCPSPSPCPYNSNAQHYRVCGVQPIQPSGLQQLQTGREPKQQQSGNEFLWNRYPKASQAT